MWQKADINLNSEAWEPIGNENHYFSGRYNGESHTITGINVNSTSIYQGLFGYILGAEQQNVIIEDLTVEGNVTGAHIVGGVVGWAGYTTIRNCINKANITSTDYEYVDNQIENECSTGGIIGKVGIYGGDIINCENYGTITSTYGGPGGIVGWCRKGNIIGCKNYASINNNVWKVGGIVACMEEGNIEKCSNSGRIEGDAQVGGICGYGGYVNSDGSLLSVNISQVTNTGVIVAKHTVGGIVGNLRQKCIVDQSSNNANVYSIGNDGDNWSIIGGIIGFTGKNSKVSYCYNTGNIESSYRGIGGIVGDFAGNGKESYIKYCYNKGDIINNNEEYSGRTGGIFGFRESDEGEISNCWQLQNCIKKGEDNAQTNIEEKTESEIKALDWDNFVTVAGKNEGYPILEWEK